MAYRLNIGCGERPLDGYINHDWKKFADHVDVAWDITKPWPGLLVDAEGSALMDNRDNADRDDTSALSGQFEEIWMRDVLEHIAPNQFYDVVEQARLFLKQGGRLKAQVPEWGSENAIIDPTHYRGFHVRSFDFLDPDTKLGKSRWSGHKGWKLLIVERLPRTKTNLYFELQKR